MADISPFTDKINALIGIFVAVLTYAFGDLWFLFATFLLLNIFDFLSRWIAARKTQTENSKRCHNGIVKKFGYWIIICVSFLMSSMFIQFGELIHVDLGITTFLGYFVLITLSVNELRSIFENLLDAGYPVPWFLTKGLEAADKILEKEIPFEKDEEEEKEE